MNLSDMFNFKKINPTNRRKSIESKMTCSAGSLESQTSTLINKEELEIAAMGTDTLSAEQFANAVGLQVESFNDVNPELSILSVMTSKDKDSPSTPAIPYSQPNTITTSSVGMAYSFPKLDMNIFVPPPGYIQSSPVNLQSLTPSNLSSTSTPPIQNKTLQRRRASDASYFYSNQSHQRTTSAPEYHEIEDQEGNDQVERIEEDIIRVLKKGRFTMTVERSAQWTSRSQRRRASSRFSLQSPNSSIQSPNSSLTTQFEIGSTFGPSLETNDHAQSCQIAKALIVADDRRDSGVDAV